MWPKQGKTETLIPDSKIFAIYDSKTESYGQPIFGLNGPDMIRRISNTFLNTEQQQNNPHFLNAEDYALYEIGSYDKSRGKIVGENPTHVVNFNELRAAAEMQMDRQRRRSQQSSDPGALLPT